MTAVAPVKTGEEMICLAPVVRVIGVPMFIPQEHFPIPNDGTDGEKIGAYAAKRCYRSTGAHGRPNLDNQRQVIQQRHGSVLQHGQYVLDIEGITRAASLELNRHDLNISQESTRYVDIERAGRIVLEPFFAGLYEKHVTKNGSLFFEECDNGPLFFGLVGVDENDTSRDGVEQRLLAEHVNEQLSSLASYSSQVEMLMELNPEKLSGFDLRKWARGKARNTLAHGLETGGVWSAGLRMWRNVIEQRSNRHAEPEIRRLAEALFEALEPWAPVYFEDYSRNIVGGIAEFTTLYTKV